MLPQCCHVSRGVNRIRLTKRDPGPDECAAACANRTRSGACASLTKMKLHPIPLLVFIGCAGLAAGQTITDPAHIEVYITPYYNSKGPTIEVGPFSNGLSAKNEPEFVATIAKMKKSWDTLNFPETYAAAIRLYDLGYRKESIYWFYSAQYRGRLFASLIDRDKMGSMGDPGFELYQAQNAFQQLVGPYINGYAFGDIDQMVPIIERVQKEGKPCQT